MNLILYTASCVRVHVSFGVLLVTQDESTRRAPQCALSKGSYALEVYGRHPTS